MNDRVRKQRRIYMVMWRAYYAIIMVGCGGVIAYFSARSGDYLFALGIVALTIAATTILLVRTFRRPRRRAALPTHVPRSGR